MTEKKQFHILAVDDNPDNLRLIVSILKKMNLCLLKITI